MSLMEGTADNCAVNINGQETKVHLNVPLEGWISKVPEN